MGERLATNLEMARKSVVASALILIALGTFPFDLQDHPHWYKVAWVPFTTGIVRPHDILVNVALYLPLGFSLQAGTIRDRRLLVAIVALAFSTLLEFTQVWSHWRFPSATDVATNVAGALVGAAWARRRLRAIAPPGSGSA